MSRRIWTGCLVFALAILLGARTTSRCWQHVADQDVEDGGLGSALETSAQGPGLRGGAAVPSSKQTRPSDPTVVGPFDPINIDKPSLEALEAEAAAEAFFSVEEDWASPPSDETEEEALYRPISLVEEPPFVLREWMNASFYTFDSADWKIQAALWYFDPETLQWQESFSTYNARVSDSGEEMEASCALPASEFDPGEQMAAVYETFDKAGKLRFRTTRFFRLPDPQR